MFGKYVKSQIREANLREPEVLILTEDDLTDSGKTKYELAIYRITGTHYRIARFTLRSELNTVNVNEECKWEWEGK